jgi:hypothetical protein
MSGPVRQLQDVVAVLQRVEVEAMTTTDHCSGLLVGQTSKMGLSWTGLLRRRGAGGLMVGARERMGRETEEAALHHHPL